jgi:transcription initiation factor TFIIE subunit beta
MSSYLQKQQDAFKSSVVSVAPKINSKRTLAAPTLDSAPSPAPSNASTGSKHESKDAKRKRESTNVVYSQPAATGYGENTFTMVNYVIEYLQRKDVQRTLEEVLGFLNLHHQDEQTRRSMATILKKHPSVQFSPDPQSYAWDAGTYAHRPKIPVRNKKQLIAYLQTRTDAQGISVKDLKDGWPDCTDVINELERENKILVTRTKKDEIPKMVWGNDPSLVHKVDYEFARMWHQTELPTVDDLVRKLQDAGQKPASEDPSKRIKAAPKAKEKKKRAPRKGGKTTNTHMAHLLKDFSHMKR